MKKIYNAPEALEILLNTQDVITASPDGNGSNVVVAPEGDGVEAEW